MSITLMDGRILPPQILLPASNRSTARQATHANGRKYRFPEPSNSHKQRNLLVTNSTNGMQTGSTFRAYLEWLHDHLTTTLKMTVTPALIPSYSS